MHLSRRDLLRSLGAGLVAGPAATLSAGEPRPLRMPTAPPDFAAVRRDFPRAARTVWLAAAETHPFSVHTVRLVEDYARQRALSEDGVQHAFDSAAQAETKQLFADLINASPDEVAFCQSTTDGENIVVAGMDLARRGGNVVIDDLHFTASRYLYAALERDSDIEVRVVRHEDWSVDPADMEAAIDRDTRLVSVALVNNINGFMHDIGRISQAAHAHGAYVYADIIQAAGCTPLDVEAMGIDAAACTGYKWLMGDFGFALLYVREDLQGTVIKPTRYGLRQVRAGGLAAMQSGQPAVGGFVPRPGAAMYEGTTSFSNLGGLCARQGIQYLTGLGVENIRAHARRLTDRLQREMPALGYPSITPPATPTPIVSFLTADARATDAKLHRAFGERVVSSRRWEITEGGRTRAVTGLRIGVSVYNDDSDIDAFLDALD